MNDMWIDGAEAAPGRRPAGQEPSSSKRGGVGAGFAAWEVVSQYHPSMPVATFSPSFSFRNPALAALLMKIARLKSKVGEITMDNELLSAKIEAARHSRPPWLAVMAWRASPACGRKPLQ
jgi:hypothetical protein